MKTPNSFYENNTKAAKSIKIAKWAILSFPRKIEWFFYLFIGQFF